MGNDTGDFNIEYCNPFTDFEADLILRAEHCGRYMWACDYLRPLKVEAVADIACADGYGTEMLSEFIDTVYGIDRDADYIEEARYDAPDNIVYLKNDLDRGAWIKRMEELDAIVCFETVEHVRKPVQLLAACYKLLAPGGLLLLSFPNVKFEKFDANGKNLDPYHMTAFPKGEMDKLLEKIGFEIIDRLSQDISNRIVLNRTAAKKDENLPTRLAGARTLGKTPEQMMLLSRMIAYPTRGHMAESYSQIYVCRKPD